MADLEDIDNVAPADSLYTGSVKINVIRARLDDLYTVLSDITTAEATQVEAIGTTTISAAQWAYIGAANQSLVTTASPTFAALTLNGNLGLSGGSYDILMKGNAVAALQFIASSITYLTFDTTTGSENIILGKKLTAGSVEIEGSNFDINGGTIDGITDLAVADGGTGSSTAGTARTALGLAIGSDVLAYDAGLSNLAGISMAADKFYYTSADNTHVAGTITAFGRSIIDDADEATFKGTVNLEIGTDVLAQQTIGIADNNLMEVDDTDAASGDYAKFTATGLQGRDATEVKTDLSLNNVENIAISSWAGSSNITTIGTVTSGTLSIGAVLADVTMTLGSDADGDIYYRTSNVLTRLAKGTGLHVLRMNAGATAPEWAAATGGVDTSGTPIANDFARFTDADTIEGREVSEVFSDLGLDAALANLTATEIAELEAIGATTISAGQWGYLGALTTDPVGGDGTAGRILRGAVLIVDNGTDAATLKCELQNRWNGDVIASTDNVAKEATTGDFTLSANGAQLTIEASGLTGNALYAIGFLNYNACNTYITTSPMVINNDIRFTVRDAKAASTLDITTLVDTGKIQMEVFYITDA